MHESSSLRILTRNHVLSTPYGEHEKHQECDQGNSSHFLATPNLALASLDKQAYDRAKITLGTKLGYHLLYPDSASELYEDHFRSSRKETAAGRTYLRRYLHPRHY